MTNLQTTLHVLGVRVAYHTNDQIALDAVHSLFGHWRELAAAHLSPNPGFDVVIEVHDDSGHVNKAIPEYEVVSPDRLVVTLSDAMGVADVTERSATVRASRTLVNDRERFCTPFIEAPTLMLVTSADRHPLHAATISNGKAALLLVGGSGSGKSTLAFAAACRGLKVLGEDTAYVQLDPVLRVWATSNTTNLVPEAVLHFPDLRHCTPTRMANGKQKIAVGLPGRRIVAPFVGPVGVVLLEPDRGHVKAIPVTTRALKQRLCGELEAGFDLRREGMVPVSDRLSTCHSWRLELSPDPFEAVTAIQHLITVVESDE